jgi:hypothetical protein
MNEEIESIKEELNLSPLAYAIASFFMLPFIAIMVIFMAILLLICWPIFPFVAYKQRKKELQDEQ